MSGWSCQPTDVEIYGAPAPDERTALRSGGRVGGRAGLEGGLAVISVIVGQSMALEQASTEHPRIRSPCLIRVTPSLPIPHPPAHPLTHPRSRRWILPPQGSRGWDEGVGRRAGGQAPTTHHPAPYLTGLLSRWESPYLHCPPQPGRVVSVWGPPASGSLPPPTREGNGDSSFLV